MTCTVDNRQPLKLKTSLNNLLNMETVKLKFGLETYTILKSEIIGFSESNTNNITQVILKGFGMLNVEVDEKDDKKIRAIFN